MGRLFQYNRFGATDNVQKNISKKDTQHKNKMVSLLYLFKVKRSHLSNPWYRHRQAENIVVGDLIWF